MDGGGGRGGEGRGGVGSREQGAGGGGGGAGAGGGGCGSRVGGFSCKARHPSAPGDEALTGAARKPQLLPHTHGERGRERGRTVETEKGGETTRPKERYGRKWRHGERVGVGCRFSWQREIGVDGGGVAFLPYIVTVSSPFAFLLQLIFRPSQKVFLFFKNIKDKKTGSAQVNRQHHTNPPSFSTL